MQGKPAPVPNNKPVLLVVRKYGQLCNRLFLFANMVAAAREYDTQIVNPAFYDYAPLFPATAASLWCRWPEPAIPSRRPPTKLARLALYSFTKRLCFSLVKWRPFAALLKHDVLSIGMDGHCWLEQPGFAARARAARVFWLEGYHYRSRPLLEKHADAVRSFFRPHPQTQQHVDKFVSEARKNCDVLVGVHIRQGDYRTYLDGKYFLETTEYAVLMRRVELLFPQQRVAFVVCSNEAQDAAHFAGLYVLRPTGGVMEDLHALAACDFVMGPVSTFSAWASFYGGPPLYHFAGADDAPTLASFVPFFQNETTY